MVPIGCKTNGRPAEQHDLYFEIAKEMKELIPGFKVQKKPPTNKCRW